MANDYCAISESSILTLRNARALLLSCCYMPGSMCKSSKVGQAGKCWLVNSGCSLQDRRQTQVMSLNNQSAEARPFRSAQAIPVCELTRVRRQCCSRAKKWLLELELLLLLCFAVDGSSLLLRNYNAFISSEEGSYVESWRLLSTIFVCMYISIWGYSR